MKLVMCMQKYVIMIAHICYYICTNTYIQDEIRQVENTAADIFVYYQNLYLHNENSI